MRGPRILETIGFAQEDCVSIFFGGDVEQCHPTNSGRPTPRHLAEGSEVDHGGPGLLGILRGLSRERGFGSSAFIQRGADPWKWHQEISKGADEGFHGLEFMIPFLLILGQVYSTLAW